jgi:hypothetical protein
LRALGGTEPVHPVERDHDVVVVGVGELGQRAAEHGAAAPAQLHGIGLRPDQAGHLGERGQRVHQGHRVRPGDQHPAVLGHQRAQQVEQPAEHRAGDG